MPESNAQTAETSQAGTECALIPYANRLGKRYRHFRRWARKQGHEAFRVYDRDMPEFPLTLDLYGEEAVLAVFARHPRHDEEDETPDESGEERAQALRRVSAEVLEFPLEAVHLRERARQKGTNQYEPLAEARHERLVMEGPLRFIVNLSDYLDTGLFLDHRPWRERLLREAKGLRVLNLFAYTGALSVAAAKGGAREVVSVDLSHTYLDWARRNLEQNGVYGSHTPLVRAEILDWIEERPRPIYDLILLDPPSFSNSKAMRGTLDIQRDHADLIRHVARWLAPQGTIWFSTNRRSFHLHKELGNFFAVRDATAASTPPDFPYSKPHKAFELQRP